MSDECKYVTTKKITNFQRFLTPFERILTPFFFPFEEFLTHLLQAHFTGYHCVFYFPHTVCYCAGKTVFTSDHALKLESVPEWIAIVGSGYIGLEFSDVYTALGSEVTENSCCQ
jgi:hypothetical protein